MGMDTVDTAEAAGRGEDKLKPAVGGNAGFVAPGFPVSGVDAARVANRSGTGVDPDVPALQARMVSKSPIQK